MSVEAVGDGESVSGADVSVEAVGVGESASGPEASVEAVGVGEAASTPEASVEATGVGDSVRTRIAYGGEPDQFGRLQLPTGVAPGNGFPVVVLIHGGFWRELFFLDLMDDLADDLADRGFASWNIEYRRVQGEGGWPETGDDVAAAIDALADISADHPIDLDRVVSVGHSAGGHLGLWALDHEERVQVRGSVGLGAVVELAYFSQSIELLGGTIDQVPEIYADAAPVMDPERVVLIHGGSDRIVPAESLQVARDAQVQIVTVEGDNHFALIDPPSDSWNAALRAIESFIGPTG